jgi:putative tryptophan/tyrosine transport system substrate-binding protein
MRAITVVFLAILAAPLAASAQPAGKVYRIAYLFESVPLDQTSSPLSALEETLRDLGYVEGRNLVVERRFAAFKYDRLPDLAAELVRLKPDLIVTSGNPSVAALKQATTTVPIVSASRPSMSAGYVTADECSK